MNAQMNAHLNSEQFDDALHGKPSPEAALHVSGCVRCSDELAAFGNFREAATLAAEHRRRFVAPAAPRLIPRFAWTLATAVLIAGIAAPLVVRHHVAAPIVNGTPMAQTPAISDEALLDNVQNDLDSSVPESLAPLAGTSTGTTSSSNTQRTDQ